MLRMNMKQNASYNIRISILLVICLHMPAIPAYDCYSSHGISCQRSTKINNTIICADQWDNCVTIFNGFTVIEKSCYSNMPAIIRQKCDDPISNECLNCFGHLCNNKGNAKCVQCNSKDHSDCLLHPGTLQSNHCPVSTSFNTYCFTRTDRMKYLQRGCLNNINDQKECVNDPLCSICLPHAGVPCNVESKTSSNEKISLLLNLIVFVLVVNY